MKGCDNLRPRPTPYGVGRKPIDLLWGNHQNCYVLIALCDDGTMWQAMGLDKGDVKWEKIPDIPYNQALSDPHEPPTKDFQ